MSGIANWVFDLYDSWSLPAMFWSFPVYIFMQIGALIKTRGYWRFAAFVPIIPMTIIFIVTVEGLARSSNLWPIILLFGSPAAFLYMCFFFVLYGLSQAKKKFHSNKSPESTGSIGDWVYVGFAFLIH